VVGLSRLLPPYAVFNSAILGVIAVVSSNMAPIRTRIACLTFLLIVFFASLPRSYAFDLEAQAVSPIDLSLELTKFDALDSDHLGPVLQKSYDLPENEAPAGTHQHVKRYGSGGPYWMSQIKRQGKVPYGANSSYVLWRNVMDYGAKGDGATGIYFGSLLSEASFLTMYRRHLRH
jgi:hypothetical protein